MRVVLQAFDLDSTAPSSLLLALLHLPPTHNRTVLRTERPPPALPRVPVQYPPEDNPALVQPPRKQICS